jgi:hypothetical protein
VPFLGLAKLRDRQKEQEDRAETKRERERERKRERERSEELQLRPGEVPLPPMPTHRPDSLLPILDRLRPEVGSGLLQVLGSSTW